ncbi:hypothetical protein [Breoghania sp.]|uniref:transcriptional regulator domain-containing protein n=1 Tax=Breoghania sp. TaxID=2065378 RepID=UPI002AA82405|nr:hypothetical protein [Breoghania sp.]
MIDYGIPDWTNPLAYGRISEVDMNRWRWEFLRRREEYQLAFDEALERQSEPISSPPDVSEEEIYLFYSQLRCWPFADPKSVAFELDLFYDPMQSNWHGAGPWWPKTGLLYGAFEDERSEFVSLTFDLSKPLRPQLDEAKLALEESYTWHFYDVERDCVRDVREPKRHPSKWLTYLRVIDGRNAGASWSEIFDVVLKPDRPTNQNGAQLARGVWERAQALTKDWPA